MIINNNQATGTMLRTHGPYVCFCLLLHMIGWGLLSLANQTHPEWLRPMGGVLIAATSIAMLPYLFLAIMIATIILLAIVAIVGILWPIGKIFFGPVAFIIISLMVVGTVVTYAGSLWAEHGATLREILPNARDFLVSLFRSEPVIHEAENTTPPPLILVRRNQRIHATLCRACGSRIGVEDPGCLDRSCENYSGEAA